MRSNLRPTLLCTVRTCGRPLHQEAGRVFCAQGHSFDQSRSGYINLLQPQDRKSKIPGDSDDAVKARRAIHDSGVTRPMLAGIASLLSLSPDDSILDIGSGEGFYLGSLASNVTAASGIDISIKAVDAAARRYPDCEWVVANADRFVPYAPRSFSRILSLTSRSNPSEFSRVLKPDGTLLIAIPAIDDLIELRGKGRDRVEQTLQAFAPLFQLIAKEKATTTAWLAQSAVQQVLCSIYRPLGSEEAKAGPVTFSLDLLLFKPIQQSTQ